MYKTLWKPKNKKLKWSIIEDGYGLGITDDWIVIRPFIYYYDEIKVSYDNLGMPNYIRTKFEKMAKKGCFNNRKV